MHGARPKKPWRERPRHRDEAAAAGTSAREAPRRPDAYRDAATPQDANAGAGARAKKPWRERPHGKAGGHPHRKGDGAKTYGKGPRPQGASPASQGTRKPVSKYAHKKKHRAGPRDTQA
jgi:ATP-dependent RNA helicase DeaD